MGEINVTVDNDIVEKFEIALRLSGESKSDVIGSLMRKYISQTFSHLAENYKTPTLTKSETDSDGANYGKALHRIPMWAKRPQQINYKIMRAFLQLSQQTDYVTYNALLSRCSDKMNHPDVFVPTFTTNFAQMKFDGDNSHGKVFEVDQKGIVTIWSIVRDVVSASQSDFLK